METAEIIAFLEVDKASGIPLKTQLEQKLDALLSRLEPKTVLPPERLMAEKLNISRVTVRNAMQKFFEQGRIVRHGRLGTMVSPKSEPEKLKKYNPMALGSAWTGNSHYPLKFLLYEDLPPQKKFWTETVKSYNAQNPDFPVEIVWMTSISDATRIANIIEEKSIDILLDSFLFDLDRKKYYHRFSEPFRKRFFTDEYLFEMFPEPPEYSLPVCMSVPMLFWNRELAEQCGLPDLKTSRFADLAARSVKKLPADVFACGRVWDYFAYTATPEAMDSPGQLRRILDDISEVGKKAGGSADRLFITSQRETLDHVESFLRGKLLFLPAPMTFLQVFDEPSFSYGQQPFPKPSGEKLAAYYIAVAITRNCLNAAAAEQFLASLISPEVQKKCGEIKKSIPIRRDECRKMLASEYGYSTRQVNAFLGSLQFSQPRKSDPQRLFFRFCIYFVREELTRLLQGTLSAREAASIISAKWQRFRKNEEKNGVS